MPPHQPALARPSQNRGRAAQIDLIPQCPDSTMLSNRESTFKVPRERRTGSANFQFCRNRRGVRVGCRCNRGIVRAGCFLACGRARPPPAPGSGDCRSAPNAFPHQEHGGRLRLLKYNRRQGSRTSLKSACQVRGDHRLSACSKAPYLHAQSENLRKDHLGGVETPSVRTLSRFPASRITWSARSASPSA